MGSPQQPGKPEKIVGARQLVRLVGGRVANIVESIRCKLPRRDGPDGLTQADITEVFDVSRSVISKRFRSEFTRVRGHWKMSLRLAQRKRAKAGSDAMLIY